MPSYCPSYSTESLNFLSPVCANFSCRSNRDSTLERSLNVTKRTGGFEYHEYSHRVDEKRTGWVALADGASLTIELDTRLHALDSGRKGTAGSAEQGAGVLGGGAGGGGSGEGESEEDEEWGADGEHGIRDHASGATLRRGAFVGIELLHSDAEKPEQRGAGAVIECAREGGAGEGPGGGAAPCRCTPERVELETRAERFNLPLTHAVEVRGKKQHTRADISPSLSFLSPPPPSFCSSSD